MSENFTINIEKEAAEYKGEFKVLAPGWRKMVIVTGGMKPTASGKGEMLVLTLASDAGGFDARLNIKNQSEIAQYLGRQELAKICECVGLTGNFALKDIPKLFGRALDVEVSVENFKSNKADVNGVFQDRQSNKAKNYAKAETRSVSNPASNEIVTEAAPVAPVTNKTPW